MDKYDEILGSLGRIEGRMIGIEKLSERVTKVETWIAWLKGGWPGWRPMYISIRSVENEMPRNVALADPAPSSPGRSQSAASRRLQKTTEPRRYSRSVYRSLSPYRIARQHLVVGWTNRHATGGSFRVSYT